MDRENKDYNWAFITARRVSHFYCIGWVIFFQWSNCTLLCTFNLSYSHRGRMIENGWKFRCAVTHSNTDVYFFALDLGGEQVLTLATWETGSGERKCQVADDNSQDILHSTTSSCLSKWFQYLCYHLIYDTKRRVGKKTSKWQHKNIHWGLFMPSGVEI